MIAYHDFYTPASEFYCASSNPFVYSSILAISDAATGVMLCRAALFGGAINVIANTGLMKDKEHADALDMKVAVMLDKYAEMADKVYADVWERLP